MINNSLQQHFASERPSRSLSFKNIGPWKIIRIIDNKAYELVIPDQLKNVGLTPIFHPWKLHLVPSNPFPGQVLPPGPPIAITEYDEEEAHEIIDCRETRKFGVQYKATFIGNWDECVEIIDSRQTSGLVLTKRRVMFSSSFSQQHAHTSSSSETHNKLHLLPQNSTVMSPVSNRQYHFR